MSQQAKRLSLTMGPTAATACAFVPNVGRFNAAPQRTTFGRQKGLTACYAIAALTNSSSKECIGFVTTRRRRGAIPIAEVATMSDDVWEPAMGVESCPHREITWRGKPPLRCPECAESDALAVVVADVDHEAGVITFTGGSDDE